MPLQCPCSDVPHVFKLDLLWHKQTKSFWSYCVCINKDTRGPSYFSTRVYFEIEKERNLFIMINIYMYSIMYNYLFFISLDISSQTSDQKSIIFSAWDSVVFIRWAQEGQELALSIHQLLCTGNSPTVSHLHWSAW